MKNQNYPFATILIFLVGVFLIVSSCNLNVMFKDAMPPNIDPVESIPKVFQGVYICESDSSLMYIFSDRVCRESYFQFKMCTRQVDEIEGCEISQNEIILPYRTDAIPFEYFDKDSIIATIHSYDTLFYFSDQTVAKVYRGRLFLNVENEADEWVTFMLTPQVGGAIALELINIPDEIETIEEITIDYTERAQRNGNTLYVLNPTLVEFDKILENNYTTECNVLHPVVINFKNIVF